MLPAPRKRYRLYDDQRGWVCEYTGPSGSSAADLVLRATEYFDALDEICRSFRCRRDDIETPSERQAQRRFARERIANVTGERQDDE